jgi:hypothetical protein
MYDSSHGNGNSQADAVLGESKDQSVDGQIKVYAHPYSSYLEGGITLHHA